MLVIEVEFLHGWLRAGPSSDAVVTGHVVDGEWPPSPARLFAALVAADGTRDRMRVTTGSGIAMLESAAPPTIEADGDRDVLRSSLQQRYVVENRRAGNTVQNYPGRQATAIRPGSQLAPSNPTVRYVYDVDVEDEVLDDLRRRSARIGYVGAADAPARVRVRTEATAHDHATAYPNAAAWLPDESGTTSLPVPTPGLLAELDIAFDRFQRGDAVRRSALPVSWQRYRAPGESDAASEPAMLWMRFDRSLPTRHALGATETLRAAILSHYPDDDAPEVLHGHGLTGTGYDTARYLVLPRVGDPFAAGELLGVAVWLPPTTEDDVVRGVRRSAAAITELVSPGRFGVGVAIHSGRGRPHTLSARRWSGPATTWTTVTPAVHERHRPPDLEEVARWCRHAGHPEPVQVAVSERPFLHGALDAQPHELRPRYAEHRYSHVALRFGQPVRGPLVIGRGRQFGMGLLVPWTDAAS